MALKFLRLKKLNPNSDLRGIVLRERPRKFSKTCKETWITKKQSILITGLAASGKTRELEKLYSARNEIFPKDNFLKINSHESVGDWITKNLKDEILTQYIESQKDNELAYQYLSKNSKKQTVQLEALEYFASGSIIFIDDIDKMQGRKKEFLKQIVKNARLIIATAESAASIDKTVSAIFRQKNFTEIELNSSQSYDVTNASIIILILAMLATGQHELAALIMVARFAMKGKQK